MTNLANFSVNYNPTLASKKKELYLNTQSISGGSHDTRYTPSMKSMSKPTSTQ